MKFSRVWRFPSFLIKQCRMGKGKPPCQYQLESSSGFCTIPACDGLTDVPTDRQTDGHTMTANTALAKRRSVKNAPGLSEGHRTDIQTHRLADLSSAYCVQRRTAHAPLTHHLCRSVFTDWLTGCCCCRQVRCSSQLASPSLLVARQRHGNENELFNPAHRRRYGL